MGESQELRTEKPTHRKREKARERGKVARSNELVAGLMIIGGVAFLQLLFPWWIDRYSEIAVKYLGGACQMEVTSDMRGVTVSAMLDFFKMLLPFFGAVIGVALVGNYLQVGFLFSTEPLSLNLSKLDPVQGFKRLFSMQSLYTLALGLVKATLIGLVFYHSIKASIGNYFALGDCSLQETIGYVARQAFSTSLKAALVLLAIGLADYAYQRRQFTKSLMMTKQELKEEYKELEGSPLIKSRIRSVQRALARQRMMKAVPTATVVVTNPVHIAVALKYDAGSMGAPTVVAKGKRLIAEKIKEIAAANGVPVFENRPLARSLFDMVEIGSEIPASLYKAVAEVLGYVYRLRGRGPELAEAAVGEQTDNDRGDR
jgi:flagellar biosynthetic protein FlhB